MGQCDGWHSPSEGALHDRSQNRKAARSDGASCAARRRDRAGVHRQIYRPQGRRGLSLRGMLTAERSALNIVQHLRSEEHTSELQSLMRISYAVFCWKKKKNGLPDATTEHKTHTP